MISLALLAVLSYESGSLASTLALLTSEFYIVIEAYVKIRRLKNSKALDDAVTEGCLEDCRYYIEEAGCDIDAKNDQQQTPLYRAVINGKFDIAKYLLGQGASVDCGVSPLFFAVQVPFSSLLT